MLGPVDILAIGAHADDVEIGMGGTIAKWAKKGKIIAVCDLTEAELSSNGTVVLRKEEAEKAADLLGIKKRINLAMPDRGIAGTPDQIQAVVEIIRELKPRIVFAPYAKDRHPDHGHASSLVKEAVFSAGIHRFVSGKQTAAHKAQLFYYMINGIHNPHFIVDISCSIDEKIAGLSAYQSQFNPPEGVSTPLTNGYIETVISRDRVMGKEINCTFGEGFITEKPLRIEHDLLGE